MWTVGFVCDSVLEILTGVQKTLSYTFKTKSTILIITWCWGNIFEIIIVRQCPKKPSQRKKGDIYLGAMKECQVHLPLKRHLFFNGHLSHEQVELTSQRKGMMEIYFVGQTWSRHTWKYQGNSQVWLVHTGPMCFSIYWTNINVNFFWSHCTLGNWREKDFQRVNKTMLMEFVLNKRKRR